MPQDKKLASKHSFLVDNDQENHCFNFCYFDNRITKQALSLLLPIDIFHNFHFIEHSGQLTLQTKTIPKYNNYMLNHDNFFLFGNTNLHSKCPEVWPIYIYCLQFGLVVFGSYCYYAAFNYSFDWDLWAHKEEIPET